MGSKKGERTRNWTFLVYPESAVEDWKEKLDSHHIAWVESPLHDKDINADGTEKKPHWHIILLYDSIKTYEQVARVSAGICGTIPQQVASVQALVRYLSHMDNPDKAQYNPADIIAHGGADLQALLSPTKAQRYKYINDMMAWCTENNIIEFEDLMQYARSEHMEDWFPLLCDSCTYVMTAFLKSRRHRTPPKVDIRTGEVID